MDAAGREVVELLKLRWEPGVPGPRRRPHEAGQGEFKNIWKTKPPPSPRPAAAAGGSPAHLPRLLDPYNFFPRAIPVSCLLAPLGRGPPNFNPNWRQAHLFRCSCGIQPPQPCGDPRSLCHLREIYNSLTRGILVCGLRAALCLACPWITHCHTMSRFSGKVPRRFFDV